MNTASPSVPSDPGADPAQKKRLIIGVLVWIAGWVLGVALVPVVNGTDLSSGLKGTLNAVLLIGFPKIFLIAAIGIMGKPGFAYLKSLMGAQVKKLAPPAEVSPMRYRIGLIMFVSLIVLGSIGPYIAADAMPRLQEHRQWVAGLGDVLLLVSLFVLGGDFWDKLRSLFVRDAKAVFPAK